MSASGPRKQSNKSETKVALVNCSDCGSEVSDKAPACPKCGNPYVSAAPIVFDTTAPAEPSKSKPPASIVSKGAIIVVVVGVIVLVIGSLAGGDNPKPANQAAVATSQPEVPAPVASDSAPAETAKTEAPVAPAEPTHNYVMTENGEYGYQPLVSDDERSKGVVTKALIMVKYRGQHDGVYTAEVTSDEGAIYRIECKDPCEFVKTKVIAGGEVLKSETIPNTPGSMVSVILEDALAGNLQPYNKKTVAN